MRILSKKEISTVVKNKGVVRAARNKERSDFKETFLEGQKKLSADLDKHDSETKETLLDLVIFLGKNLKTLEGLTKETKKKHTFTVNRDKKGRITTVDVVEN